jgi:hypothetical protein
VSAHGAAEATAAFTVASAGTRALPLRRVGHSEFSHRHGDLQASSASFEARPAPAADVVASLQAVA